MKYMSLGEAHFESLLSTKRSESANLH